MLRFQYLVHYDSDAPQENDDPLTDDEVVDALSRFWDDLRCDVVAADPNATVNPQLAKSNRATTRSVVVKTTLDAGTIDEAVQRCALRHHLKAALLACG
jgi:hypothetical protein